MSLEGEHTERHTVFVYGTLRSGASNAFRMRGAKSLGAALLNAKLYRVHEQFPGIIISEDESDLLVGEVFTEVSGELLHLLDVYEGCDESVPEESHIYRRIRVRAVLELGRAVELEGDLSAQGETECWVWEYIKPVSERNRILSGDWLLEKP